MPGTDMLDRAPLQNRRALASTLSPCAVATFSSSGAISWQGPHQFAKKSDVVGASGALKLGRSRLEAWLRRRNHTISYRQQQYPGGATKASRRRTARRTGIRLSLVAPCVWSTVLTSRWEQQSHVSTNPKLSPHHERVGTS